MRTFHYMIYLFILTASVHTVLMAQNTKTFTGPDKGIWLAPEHWNPPGTPTAKDHVVIPEGKTVEITYSSSLGNAQANTITNNGAIHMKDGIVQTNSFTNNATVRFVNAGEAQKNTITGHGENKADVTNNGTIQGSENYTSSMTIDGKNVENNGTLIGDNLNIKGENVVNNENGKIQVNYFYSGISVTGTEKVVNKGEISTGPDSRTDIIVTGKKVTNEGTIKTAEREYGSKSGDIQITGQFVTNTSSGSIQTGKNEVFPELTGKVKVNGNFDNFGKIRSGSSPGSDAGGRQDQYFNNVTIAGDTIRLYGDSTRIEADTLRIYFNYLKIAFVTQYACIWGDMVVEFYGSQGATIDLSEGNGQGIISVGFGEIRFFCDNIIEPPQGLNYVCDLPPVVYGSDSTIKGVETVSGFETLSAGVPGEVKIPFINRGTLPATFDFAITDQKGWIQNTSGTTQPVGPFQFDSLFVSCSLPSQTDSLPDSVYVSLSSGNRSVLSEAVWVLYPIRGSASATGNQTGNENTLIDVYPVPFHHILYIRAHADIEISIVDLNGRCIFNAKVNKSQTVSWIPPAGLPTGVYTVYASSLEKGPRIRKIIYQPK